MSFCGEASVLKKQWKKENAVSTQMPQKNPPKEFLKVAATLQSCVKSCCRDATANPQSLQRRPAGAPQKSAPSRLALRTRPQNTFRDLRHRARPTAGKGSSCRRRARGPSAQPRLLAQARCHGPRTHARMNVKENHQKQAWKARDVRR